MLAGIIMYSFTIGSLTSLIAILDSKQAKLKDKLTILDELYMEYHFDYETYIKIRRCLKYENSRNESDKYEFLNDLPQQLKVEVSVLMHQNIIQKLPFFQGLDPYFISFFVPLLKNLHVQKGEYIYKEGAPSDSSIT